MEQEDIERQIERCRRLASMMTDDEVRHSLEQMASEYEEHLAQPSAGFMLTRRED